VKEDIQIVSFCNKKHLCIHIESTSPSDGTSELIFEFESEQHEANLNLTDVNLIELNQGSGQCSKQPNANFAQEGKLRCIIPLFFALFTSNYSLYVVIIFLAHLRS